MNPQILIFTLHLREPTLFVKWITLTYDMIIYEEIIASFFFNKNLSIYLKIHFMQVIMIMLGNYYQKHAAFFVAKRADVGNG